MSKTTSQPVSSWLTPALIEWLFGSGRLIADNHRFTHELALQLVAAGAPVDGTSDVTPTGYRYGPNQLNLTIDAGEYISIMGPSGSGKSTFSPLEFILEQRRSLHQPLQDLPPEPHAAYVELLASGYTDYLGLPVEFSDGAVSAIIFSTKQSSGFGLADIDSLHRLRDYLAPILELQSTRHTAVSVMNTYVGKRTGLKIMDVGIAFFVD